MAETTGIHGARPGALNSNWKGGRSVASNGYVLVRVGASHHLADVRGYAYEHRLVAEAKVGRRLRQGEHVHHIDGDKTNNTPENIEVLSHQEHAVAHRRSRRREALRMPDEANPVVECACGCGVSFRRFDRTNRPRRFISGHNLHVVGGANG